MFPRLLPLAASALLLALLTPLCRAADYKVVAYVPNWIDLDRFADEIPYAKLTHLNLAFANPANDAGDLDFSPTEAALVEKAHAARVQVLLSIGGGTASGDQTLRRRYARLMAPESRAAYAAKLATFLTEHHLDGLDADLEGPAIDALYGPFIHELAAALRPRGLLLTAALTQYNGGDRVPASVLTEIDFLNIMAYDGTGPWNPRAAGPHSTLEFARQSARYWLARGLPKAKAVLGVPFYGYGFGSAYRRRGYPYRELLQTYPGAEAGDQVGNTIWHNAPPTLRAKARFVKEEGLAGVMIWSLDCDAPGEKSLLSVLSETLRQP